MADLSALVVSYNVRELLDACLASVLADISRFGLSLRLVVVDNCSGDGSADMVAERYPTADLIRSDANRGFGGGANLGLAHLGFPAAGGDTPVLLLNPDTEVRPGALPLLIEDLRRYPSAGVVGPGLVYADGTPQHAAFRFPGLAQAYFDLFPPHWRLAESRLNGRYGREERRGIPFPCDHVLGAAMLLRPQAIRDVSTFDEGFFMYCEEVDWCWRAAGLGWHTWNDPRATLVHHAGRSTVQSAGPMYVELWRSRYRLMLKHGRSLGPLRTIVRLGMAKRRRDAARALAAGAISADAYASSLETYAAVAAL
ncbi:MAG: glycosyltransferase family 2 protein [Anaerolineae bacterium]